MTIDIERLRSDLKEEQMGTFFGGDFGAALIESFDVDRASPEKLVEMAQRQGVDLKNYQI